MRRSSTLVGLLLVAAVALVLFFTWDDILRLGDRVNTPGRPPPDEGIRAEHIPDEWYSCANANEWFAPDQIEAMLLAAERGDQIAQYASGVAYMTGLGVECSAAKGADMFLRAALSGMPQAQYVAGLLYQWGYGVPESHRSALDWYSKAADERHAGALNALSLSELEEAQIRFDHGDRSIEQCLTGECLIWIRNALEEAAAYENDRAMVNLGFVNGFIAQRVEARGYLPEAVEYYQEAYFWYSLASLYRDDEEVRTIKRALADKMPDRLVDELDDKAASWRPERPAPPANDPVETDPAQFL